MVGPYPSLNEPNQAKKASKLRFTVNILGKSVPFTNARFFLHKFPSVMSIIGLFFANRDSAVAELAYFYHLYKF